MVQNEIFFLPQAYKHYYLNAMYLEELNKLIILKVLLDKYLNK